MLPKGAEIAVTGAMQEQDHDDPDVGPEDLARKERRQRRRSKTRRSSVGRRILEEGKRFVHASDISRLSLYQLPALIKLGNQTLLPDASWILCQVETNQLRQSAKSLSLHQTKMQKQDSKDAREESSVELRPKRLKTSSKSKPKKTRKRGEQAQSRRAASLLYQVSLAPRSVSIAAPCCPKVGQGVCLTLSFGDIPNSVA